MADVKVSELPVKGTPVDADTTYITDSVSGESRQSPRGGMRSSASEVKTDYESNADTNAFTDAEKASVASSASQNTGSVTVHSDVTNAGSGAIITGPERTKLDGIEAGATADQTPAQIKTSYESNADTNAFTDSEKAEVAANTAKVSASGSVTTHSNVTSAGSGQIITAQERTDINASVTVHSDVSDAGSGAIITTGERSNLSTLSAGPASNADSLHTHEGALATGTYKGVEKDAAPVSSNRPTLNFSATGDATVTVTDDAGNNRTNISIDATAGGGGAGVGAGTPFVIGDLVQVQSDAGDGTIQSAAVTAAMITANNAKVSASGSVTTHSDVTNAGSGQIITGAERSAITANTAKVSADGSVTTHNDVTSAGSGIIITAVERTKLSGIETNATTDQTPAEIKTGYESNADTNAFTDAEASKLAGIAAGAEVNVINAVVDDTSPQLGGDFNLNGFGTVASLLTGATFAAGEAGIYNAAASTGVVLADASSAATATGVVIIAVNAVTSGNSGFFYIGGLATLAGVVAAEQYFLSTTAGQITTTAPTGTGEIVRAVGTGASAGLLFLSADNTVIELA